VSVPATGPETGVTPAPADGSAGLPYHRLQRRTAWSWWRPLVGVLAVLALVLVVQNAAVLGVLAFLVLTGTPTTAALDTLSGDRLTPGFLTAINLGWALCIPAVWAVAALVHRMRPGWLASVRPRIRWGWFATCLGLALVTLLVTLVVSALLAPLMPASDSVGTTGSLNDFTSTSRDFLLIIVLLTPLQAAGEEYAFRGYLTQALGGLVRSPRLSAVVAVVVPATLFALAHGLGQDPTVFLDRLAFGLVAGVLVILTGGLEAGIAMHVLNNWFAFGLALAVGDIGGSLEPSGGSWVRILVTLTQSLVFLGLALLVSRSLGLATRSTPRELEAPTARV